MTPADRNRAEIAWSLTNLAMNGKNNLERLRMLAIYSAF